MFLGINYRGQLSLPGSRQASSNASEGGVGGYNRDSSLDDSGVVDDHYDLDTTGADLLNASNIEVCDRYLNTALNIQTNCYTIDVHSAAAGRRDTGDHCTVTA